MRCVENALGSFHNAVERKDNAVDGKNNAVGKQIVRKRVRKKSTFYWVPFGGEILCMWKSRVTFTQKIESFALKEEMRRQEFYAS